MEAYLRLVLLLLALEGGALADSFSDYPPVDVERLSPTEISWNQVRATLASVQDLLRWHLVSLLRGQVFFILGSNL